MEKSKNVDDYIAMQQNAIQSNPECSVSHYNLATALLGKKNYKEAEKAFLCALDNSPHLVEAYIQLGGIRLAQNDLDGCLYYNRLAVKYRAGFAIGYGNIGFALLQKGEYDEAVAVLKKAIKFNPKFIQAYATLANAYLMNKEIDESIEINLKAMEIDSNFPIIHNNLAIAYIEKKEYKLSIKHCDKSIELGYPVAEEILEELKKYR